MANRTVSMADTTLTEEEVAAAVRVLRSGALRQGKECEAFEAEFAELTGAKHAVSCSNGSAALQLAYLSFLKPGDEVLVPAFTFIATASMVVAAGGTPVFCDIDPATFLLDLKDAEAKITERTKAIAPVHIFGNACDIEAFRSFADKHNLRVVWDAAQAHGASYKGRDVGSYGDFACYSFYPTKNLFVGEGGMICTNDAQADEWMRFARSHGQTGKYRHTMLGLNLRMTDVEGAIGREQLKRFGGMLEVRRRNGRMLNDAFSKVPGVTPQAATPDTEHAYHQYCVLIDPDEFGMDRDGLERVLGEKGIGTGHHYPKGLHQQPVFEDMYGKPSLPVTEATCERVIALPVHHGLEEEDIRYVADSIVEAQKAK